VLAQPDVKARLAGAVVMPLSVAEFRAFLGGESAKYLNDIKETALHRNRECRSAVKC
jgi:hypothetical protein